MFTTINQPNTQSTVKVQIPSMPNLLLRLEGLTVFSLGVGNGLIPFLFSLIYSKLSSYERLPVRVSAL